MPDVLGGGVAVILQIYVDDETQRRLEAVARESGRTVEDLAESAVAEAALDSERRRPSPPATAQLPLR